MKLEITELLDEDLVGKGEHLPSEYCGVPLFYYVDSRGIDLMCPDCATLFIRETNGYDLLESETFVWEEKETCTECGRLFGG